MKEATKIVRERIIEGKVDRSLFTKVQLEDIMAGRDRIAGYTWHHHQDLGRMQLISRDVHRQTGHIGGMKVWPFKE